MHGRNTKTKQKQSKHPNQQQTKHTPKQNQQPHEPSSELRSNMRSETVLTPLSSTSPPQPPIKQYSVTHSPDMSYRITATSREISPFIAQAIYSNGYYQQAITSQSSLAVQVFFLLYAAWVRSRAERPSVSYTKVVSNVAWTGHNLQYTKTN